MTEKIITDNAVERIVVTWNGNNYVLGHTYKALKRIRAIILNPREMDEIVDFRNEVASARKEEK